MSSFEALLFAPVGLFAIFFSEDERSVVAEASPLLRPSAYAYACLALSISVGTPLFSRIS